MAIAHAAIFTIGSIRGWPTTLIACTSGNALSSRSSRSAVAGAAAGWVNTMVTSWAELTTDIDWRTPRTLASFAGNNGSSSVCKWIVANAHTPSPSTSKTLIDKAKTMTLDAAGGHYAWDAKGDVTGRTFAVVTVKDGKFTSTGQSVDEKGLETLRK